MLDLDYYLPPSSSGEKTESAGAGGWSDKSIDVSALRKADADLRLTMAGIKRNRLTLGATEIAIALREGRLDLSAPSIAMFGGTTKGRVRIDAAGAVPALALDADIAGVQAEPLLSALADSHRLEGTTNAAIRVQTRGSSQRAMVSSLNGTANVAFLNGAIKGINIASALRQLKAVYLDPNASASQKTDFAELSGSFAIRNGVAHTEDLKMLAPLLRLRGKGDVLLPDRRIAMRLEPELVGTLKGQGGDEARGIRVPVLVSGPLDHPSFTPDVQGMAEKAVRKQLEGVLGNQGAGGGGRVGGFLRGLTGAPAANDAQGGAEPKPANPVENLRHLFGR
jgi:AsmA protein